MVSVGLALIMLATLLTAVPGLICSPTTPRVALVSGGTLTAVLRCRRTCCVANVRMVRATLLWLLLGWLRPGWTSARPLLKPVVSVPANTAPKVLSATLSSMPGLFEPTSNPGLCSRSLLHRYGESASLGRFGSKSRPRPLSTPLRCLADIVAKCWLANLVR